MKYRQRDIAVEAGFEPSDDCAPRALAAATGMPYADAFRLLVGRGRKTTGVNYDRFFAKLMQLGFTWVPAWEQDTTPMADRAILSLRNGRREHAAAVVDGELIDVMDTRDWERVGRWEMRTEMRAPMLDVYNGGIR